MAGQVAGIWCTYAMPWHTLWAWNVWASHWQGELVWCPMSTSFVWNSYISIKADGPLPRTCIDLTWCVRHSHAYAWRVASVGTMRHTHAHKERHVYINSVMIHN